MVIVMPHPKSLWNKIIFLILQFDVGIGIPSILVTPKLETTVFKFVIAEKLCSKLKIYSNVTVFIYYYLFPQIYK